MFDYPVLQAKRGVNNSDLSKFWGSFACYKDFKTWDYTRNLQCANWFRIKNPGGTFKQESVCHKKPYNLRTVQKHWEQCDMTFYSARLSQNWCHILEYCFCSSAVQLSPHKLSAVDPTLDCIFHDSYASYSVTWIPNYCCVTQNWWEHWRKSMAQIQTWGIMLAFFWFPRTWSEFVWNKRRAILTFFHSRPALVTYSYAWKDFRVSESHFTLHQEIITCNKSHMQSKNEKISLEQITWSKKGKKIKWAVYP